MRIREITKHSIREGALGNIGRGFVQGVTGVDFSRDQPEIDADALKAAQATLATANERIVVAISQPGQSIPANYYKTNNTWANELGAPITDPKQISYLDKLIPTHGKKEIIPVSQQTKKISRRRVNREGTAKIR